MKFRFYCVFQMFICLAFKAQTLVVNPNPFVNRTLVSYTISAGDTATMNVTDATGRVSLTLYSNHFFASGAYQDSINMDGFPAGIYYLSLKFKNGNAKVLKMVKTGVLGISEFENKSWIHVYPNPVRDKIFLESAFIELFRIKIYSPFGEMLSEINVNEPLNEIDFTRFDRGIYFLLISNQKKQKILKVLKE
jgi:Secretion system C-terminal sorting domain